MAAQSGNYVVATVKDTRVSGTPIIILHGLCNIIIGECMIKRGCYTCMCAWASVVISGFHSRGDKCLVLSLGEDTDMYTTRNENFK